MFILGGLFWLFRWRVTPVVGGMAYLGWPLLAIAYFRDSASGGFVLLYIFLTVWAVDIFAMFSGKLFGGPRMAPRISPNKTWAGLMGAVVGASIVALITYYSANALVALTLTLPVILLLGGVLAVVSQMGDLFESALKRKYDLKDTGSILPGHGGVLDRVDGLIGALIFLHLLCFCAAGRRYNPFWCGDACVNFRFLEPRARLETTRLIWSAGTPTNLRLRC